MNGEPVGPRKFEDMAANYIEEIRAFQPKGPYFIGGFCLGGSLAIEMAQQLQNQKEEVALLVLIEASHPDYPKFLPDITSFHRLLYRIMDRVSLEATTLLEVKPEAKSPHIIKRSKRVLTIAKIMSEKTINPFLKRLGLNTAYSLASRLEALGEAHNNASRNYKPRPYQGRAVLLRAAIQPTGIDPDPAMGWGDLIEDLDIEVIPGHRINMLLEPRVRVTAKKLNAHLKKAQNRNAGIRQRMVP